MKLSNETLKRAAELRQRIYSSPRGGAGCCWHVVLDDGNVEDSFVEYAEDTLSMCRGDREACRELGAILLLMSKTQRLKLGRGGYDHLLEEKDDHGDS